MIKRAVVMRIAGLCVSLALVSGGARAADDEDWKYGAAIYAWVPNIDIKLKSGQKGEITQDDIISNLDMAFQGVLRAARGRWSVSADMIYFDLSSDNHRSRGRLQLLTLGKISLQQGLITPNLGYRFYESESNWSEVYVGARYAWIQADLKFQRNPPLRPGSFTESDKLDHWDAVVGVRGEYSLSDKWFIPYVADIGTGESDYVTNLMAGFGYRFKSLDAIAAYRYIRYDFGDDWVLEKETPSGPLVGVVFRF